MILHESNDSALSSSITQDLHLNKFADVEEEAVKEVNPANKQPQELQEDSSPHEEEGPTNQENSLPNTS